MGVNVGRVHLDFLAGSRRRLARLDARSGSTGPDGGLLGSMPQAEAIGPKQGAGNSCRPQGAGKRPGWLMNLRASAKYCVE